jgi:hypothetical protein
MQDIADLAVLVCDTPYATLNLRGVDVIWSRYGARIEDGASPKSNPFNDCTIQCTDLFEVFDVSADKRFADGSVVGALAVLDAVSAVSRRSSVAIVGPAC